jgi:hypothetical protein
VRREITNASTAVAHRRVVRRRDSPRHRPRHVSCATCRTIPIQPNRRVHRVIDNHRRRPGVRAVDRCELNRSSLRCDLVGRTREERDSLVRTSTPAWSCGHYPCIASATAVHSLRWSAGVTLSRSRFNGIFWPTETCQRMSVSTTGMPSSWEISLFSRPNGINYQEWGACGGQFRVAVGALLRQFSPAKGGLFWWDLAPVVLVG